MNRYWNCGSLARNVFGHAARCASSSHHFSIQLSARLTDQRRIYNCIFFREAIICVLRHTLSNAIPILYQQNHLSTLTFSLCSLSSSPAGCLLRSLSYSFAFVFVVSIDAKRISHSIRLKPDAMEAVLISLGRTQLRGDGYKR